MNRGTDFSEADFVDHCHRNFRNQVARVFGNNRRSYDLVRTLFRMHFDKTFVLSLQNGAVNVGQLLDVGVDFDSGFLRLSFVNPDMGNFRGGVRSLQDDEIADFLFAERADSEEGILNDDTSHKVCGVRELVF